MSVVEEFSGIDVNDMLQLRKEKRLLFLHAFAYVFDLGLPSKFVAAMRPCRRCSVTFAIF